MEKSFKYLELYQFEHIETYFAKRENEIKLGQQFQFITNLSAKELNKAKNSGVKYAMVGINEDIGPRANLGKGGATGNLSLCLETLLNFQANEFFNGSECLLVGNIQTHDLTDTQEVKKLREYVSVIDKRVQEVILPIIDAGLEPIVIGGGHNNAYGLLSAVKQSKHLGVAAINLDHHSDFRLKEGRHSGNGFSYAAASGALAHYHILGLHQQKNSQKTLQQLRDFGASWHSFQKVWIAREISLKQALHDISHELLQTQLPVGLELDLDTISQLPASAMTEAGVPLNDALYYVNYIAAHCPCAYLHLAEAACQDHNDEISRRRISQTLAELVLTYMCARNQWVDESPN